MFESMEALARVAIVACVVAAHGCGSRDDARPPKPPSSRPVQTVAERTTPTRARRAVETERWRDLLSFDAGGHDLSITSFSVPDGPPMVRWSDLSFRVCGEDNPVGTIVALGPDANITRNVDRARGGLRCGRLVSDHLPRAARVDVLELDRRGRPLPITVIPTTLTDLAPLARAVVDFRPERHRARDVLCRAFEQDGRTCEERQNDYDHGIAVVEGYILAGSFPVLARFVDWTSAPRVLALLADITRRFDATEAIEVDFLAPGGVWMIGPRRWLPFTTDAISDDLADTVRLRARAVGWDRGLTAGTIVVLPRCEDDSCGARDELASALRAYHEEWKRTARARMESLMGESADAAAATECLRRVEQTRFEALAATSVTTSDGTIRIAYQTNDAGSLACLHAADAETRDAAVERVRATFGDL